jgi:NADH dehydrogenase FAD-containing subunit/HAMP domain-containing protein
MSAMAASAASPAPARSAARPDPAVGRVLPTRSTSLAPRIVVLGGGFGGVTAALALARRCAGLLPVRVTLVSDRNYFLFTPMLAEAATGAVDTRHVLHPIRPLCTATGVEFAEMTVEGIDLERRRVAVRHQRSAVRQELHYDRLVIALGAAPNTAIAPGAAEHALTFKGAGDAIRIRNRIIDLFEAAALTDDPWGRRQLLTFVVVGAGHAGTELMAALEELARGILLRHYPTVPGDTVRLVLVGSGILPQTASRLAAWAKDQLEGRRRLGWRLGAAFVAVTAVATLVSGGLEYRAQTAGIRASLGALLLSIARTGTLLVDPALHLEVQLTRTPDSEAYGYLHKTLAAIQDANELETPIRTLSDYEPPARQARIVVMSRGSSQPGEAYALVPELVPAFEQTFGEGVPTTTPIYRNDRGTWLTAFAPIKGADGQTIAVLEVDYRADIYLAALAAARRRLLWHLLAGGALAAGVGVLVARRVTGPVNRLAGLARSVVEGDLTARVRVRSRDEIGMLGNVFHLMVERLGVSHRSMVDVLVRALEARGGAPGALRRVADAALAIGERLALTLAQREALELGALLHDVGEIRTPETVLGKPGALTMEERRLVEAHPVQGVEILETVPLLAPALDAVGGHHERWDGGGYPNGLREDAIPLTARIVAVADALDAMTHDRPHRKARPLGEALETLREGAGKQFDPRIVEVALAVPAGRWAELLGVSA